jgi:hypothetical protein
MEWIPLFLIFCLTPSDPPLPSPSRSRFGEARQGRGGGVIQATSTLIPASSSRFLSSSGIPLSVTTVWILSIPQI